MDLGADYCFAGVLLAQVIHTRCLTDAWNI